MSNKVFAFILIIIFVIALVFVCRSKRMRKGFKVLGVIVCGILILMFGSVLLSPAKKDNTPNPDPNLRYGDVMSITEDNGSVTIKAKMNVWSDDKAYLVIDNSFANVERLIEEDGFNNFNEINYEAYVVMESPTKVWDEHVLSFTLEKDTIDGIYNGNINEPYIRNFAKDLWVSEIIDPE